MDFVPIPTYRAMAYWLKKEGWHTHHRATETWLGPEGRQVFLEEATKLAWRRSQVIKSIKSSKRKGPNMERVECEYGQCMPTNWIVIPKHYDGADAYQSLVFVCYECLADAISDGCNYVECSLSEDQEPNRQAIEKMNEA